MTRPPPHERPTARQMASGSTEPLQIAGKPADVCPYCGAGMFVNKTQGLQTRIDRYETCRNCSRKFVTRQPQKVFVREISQTDEVSSGGNHHLTVRHGVG